MNASFQQQINKQNTCRAQQLQKGKVQTVDIMKELICKQHTRIAQCSGSRKQYSLELHSSARYLRYAQKASHRQYDAQYNTQSYRLMKEEDPPPEAPAAVLYNISPLQMEIVAAA